MTTAPDVIGLVADVADSTQVDAVVQRVVADTGRIDQRHLLHRAAWQSRAVRLRDGQVRDHRLHKDDGAVDDGISI
jgi:NAD(P)-dependent dehydrogenase (short-subunit alcohol dehydrogenase family)